MRTIWIKIETDDYDDEEPRLLEKDIRQELACCWHYFDHDEITVYFGKEPYKAYNISESGFLCSKCTFGDFGLFKDYKPRFCPNCGARITEAENA